MRWLALALGLSSFWVAAWSESDTGNWLYFELMTGDKLRAGLKVSEAEHADHLEAMGYTKGAVDALIWGGVICVPNQTKWGVLQDTIYLHLKENPEDRSLAALAAIAKSLSKPFKCRTGK